MKPQLSWLLWNESTPFFCLILIELLLEILGTGCVWVVSIPRESSDSFPVSEPHSLRWLIYNGYWCLHKEGATEALGNKSWYFIHYLWEVIDSHLLWLPRYSGTICTLRNLEADHLTGLSERKQHFDEFRWVFVTGSCLPRQSAQSLVNLCESMTHYGTFSNNSFLLNVPLIGRGCVLSPLLYALYTYDYTYDCTLSHQSNTNHQVCWWHHSGGAHLEGRWGRVRLQGRTRWNSWRCGAGRTTCFSTPKPGS